MTKPPTEDPPKSPESLSPLTVLASVFRSWFGVQTEKNRQRDFSSNDPTPFIIAGIIFTVGMIIAVIIVVKMALSAAGS
ncbi:MAG: DUF2970 domain-containing protein [Moraxellaceae bacterium]|nr:DUF2970 domain-containing protein [Moraxellaceae bacterium]MDP1775825.1 DUF2970 domain-containing protein [Moraxellaceae bacterium]